MKHRDSWIVAQENKDALFAHLKQVREKESIEKSRKHFQPLHSAIENFRTSYGEIFNICESNLSLRSSAGSTHKDTCLLYTSDAADD